MNKFDLSGKVIIITGGTGVIGMAITKTLLDLGAKVVCCSASTDKAIAKAEELDQTYDKNQSIVIKVDVCENVDVEYAIRTAIGEFGQVDGLINCAGGNRGKKSFLETTMEDFQTLMDLNLYGAIRMSQAVAGQMLKQGTGGVIVNICSVASQVALSGVTPYACAKSGLLALTRQMAVDPQLIEGDIRTNAVEPGFFPGEQNREILALGDRGLRIKSNTPMGRYGLPEEIASVVAFLCSPGASFINGTCINIDGGFLACGICNAGGKIALDITPNPTDDVTTLDGCPAVSPEAVPVSAHQAPQPGEISHVV
ncbi:MAG: SDR family oxidoreductase [Patescibacteria group bacterium]